MRALRHAGLGHAEDRAVDPHKGGPFLHMSIVPACMRLRYEPEFPWEVEIYAPKLEFYADDKRAMLRFLWMTNRPC